MRRYCGPVVVAAFNAVLHRLGRNRVPDDCSLDSIEARGEGFALSLSQDMLAFSLTSGTAEVVPPRELYTLLDLLGHHSQAGGLVDLKAFGNGGGESLRLSLYASSVLM